MSRGTTCCLLELDAGRLARPVLRGGWRGDALSLPDYYTNDDELTDITNGNVWSANEWEDGVANGNNVYNWHNQCTPGGLGVAINSCFVNFNGGGPPYYGLQYGMDICTGLVTSWVSFCFHHGQRRWIDDYGDPTTYYDW